MFNELISSLIDLRYQAKNAHWNCKGMLFYQFHLLFDRIYEDYEEIIDRLAERSVGMGGRVTGTTHQLVSILGDQPLEISAIALATDLLDKINQVRDINIGYLTEINDLTTQAQLTDVQEILDRHKFLLESSLT